MTTSKYFSNDSNERFVEYLLNRSRTSGFIVTPNKRIKTELTSIETTPQITTSQPITKEANSSSFFALFGNELQSNTNSQISDSSHGFKRPLNIAKTGTLSENAVNYSQNSSSLDQSLSLFMKCRESQKPFNDLKQNASFESSSEPKNSQPLTYSSFNSIPHNYAKNESTDNHVINEISLPFKSRNEKLLIDYKVKCEQLLFGKTSSLIVTKPFVPKAFKRSYFGRKYQFKSEE